MAGIYDDLAARDKATTGLTMPAVAADDTYGAMAAAEAEQRRERLKQTIGVATKVPPEQAGTARILSEKTGLPVDLVERNTDTVAQQQRATELYRAAADSPILARQLVDPNFAKIAQDDTPPLTTLEKVVRSPWKAIQSVASGLPSLFSGIYGLAAAPLEVANQALEATPYGTSPLLKSGGAWLREQAKGQRTYAERVADLPPDAGFVARAVSSGFQSLGQNAPLLIAAMYTGNPTMALSVMSASAGGSSYVKGTEAGLSPVRAAAYGATDAGYEYLTEMLPVTKLLGDMKAGTPFLQMFLKNQVSEQLGEQAATVLQDFNEWAVLKPNSTFGEYMAERPSAALATAIATVIGSGGQVVLLKAAEKAAGRDKMAGTEEADTFKKIFELANESRLRERSPASFAAFVQDAASEGPVEAVYVHAATFQQAAQEAGIDITKMPETAAAMQDALDTNSDVRIPLGELAATIPGTTLEQSIIPLLRTSPDGPTQAEAADTAWVEETKQQTEKILADQQQDTAWKESVGKVQADLTAQLTTANRFTNDVNTAYAGFMSAFYGTQAARLGITPEEMYKRYPLQIRASGVGGANTMNQQGTLVNIGMDIPAGGRHTPERVLEALQAAGVQVEEHQVHASDTEPTVVARLDRPLTPEQANAVSEALGQEAIVQMHEGVGALHGPQAAKWGDFNPEYFLMLDGQRASQALQQSGRVKNDTPAIRRFLKHLTPAELRKVTDSTAKKILDRLSTLPSAKEMAAVAFAGRAKRGWYQQSAQAISDVFGPDAPRFAMLLAAMSPQTSVESNLKNALNTWKNWLAAGRPMEREAIIDIMAASVEGNGDRSSVLDAWINNSVRALGNEAVEEVMLSGPKVNSFYKNLIGVVEEITLDTWMANYALIEQTVFATGSQRVGDNVLSAKGPGYIAYNARVREAAAALSKYTGETWTPAEVQETIWSWAKTLYELADSANETRSAEQIVMENGLSDELIKSTPDFSSLFNDPQYASILEEAGYAEELGQLADTRDANGRQPGEDDEPARQAAPFADEAQRRYEIAAARRLDKLRAERAANTLQQSARDGGGKAVRGKFGFSVTGVHYSKQGRRQLDGFAYGSGLRGTEDSRLAQSSDPRLTQRIHFYVNEGQGVSPEIGVGEVAHTAKLDNLYDTGADPEGLLAANPGTANFNAFESAVLDAGYSGVYTRGAQGSQGVAVLLGDQSIRVQLGKDAAPAAPPDISPEQQIVIEFAKDRRLQAGQMTPAEWEQFTKVRAPDLYERMPEGAFEVMAANPFPQSKVKRTVYHGSDAVIEKFDMAKAKDGAHFFTGNSKHAAHFGEARAYRIDIQNPMEIDQDALDAAWDKAHPDGEQDDRNLLPRDFVEQFVTEAKAAGHDGLIIRKMGDLDLQEDVYLPFTAEQIVPVGEAEQKAVYRDALARAMFSAYNPRLTGANNGQNRGAAGTYGQSEDLLATVAGGRAQPGWSRATRIRRGGRPALLYRGASRPLVAAHFDAGSLGQNTGHASSSMGVFFSTAPAVAEQHGNVEQFHLDIRNPFVIEVGTESAPAFDTAEEAAALREQLIAEGYDGIVLSTKAVGGGRADVVAFYPDQVIVPGNTLAQSVELKTEQYQDVRGDITIPAGTVMFHGAHAERAAEIEAAGKLTDKPSKKSGGGLLTEGGLVWFGTRELAERHSAGEVDTIASRDRIGAAGGKTFPLVLGRPVRLLDPNRPLTAEEAAKLNDVLGIPSYKKLDAGESASRGVGRAFDSSTKKDSFERYETDRGRMMVVWPKVFEALGYDGMFDNSGIAFAGEIALGSTFAQSEPLLAPNGKRSKLTPKQHAEVRTPAFKKWFGDWEYWATQPSGVWGAPAGTVSVAVDPETGEPLVLYHGTDTAGFSEFENKKYGIFLTPDAGAAGTYVRKGRLRDVTREDLLTAEQEAEGEERPEFSGRYAVFANMRNVQEEHFEGANFDGTRDGQFQVWDVDAEEPVYSKDGRAYFDESEAEKLYDEASKGGRLADAKNVEIRPADEHYQSTDGVVKEAAKYGRDGAIIRQVIDDGGGHGGSAYDPIDVYVVFSGEQLKSADFNDGSYDLDDPSIMSQDGPTARGEISFANDIKSTPTTITLLQNADLSTFLHESGHFYLEVLNDMASAPGAPQAIVDDFNRVLQWFGVKDAETWRAMTLEQKRPHHEQWARGFEAYLFEGKSPNTELNGVFGRFRAWLINVYQQIARLDVILSDEVRGVMDRLVATNEQIATAEAARGFAPLFSSKPEQMSKEEWTEYQSLGAEATQEAVDLLQTRGLRDMQWLQNARSRIVKRLQRDAAGKRKSVRAEVAAEVEAQPVYRAIAFLTRGMLDGEKVNGAKLSLVALRDMYGNEPNALWRYFTTGKTSMVSAEGLDGALHPDQVAEMFGFTSGDHLVRELLAAEPASSVIDGMTDQRMLERYGDLADPRSIEKAADQAIHSEARARFVGTELRMLAKATGQRNILVKAAKDFAAALVARKQIRNINPNTYAAAETRAGKAAERATIAGKLVEAATEKRNQLVNLYATKASYDAVAEVERAVAYLKRVGDSKTIDPEYRAQIQTLLDRFDLRKVSNKDAARRQSLLEWVEDQKARGMEPVIDPALLAEAERLPYREMTLEAFRGLVDSVKNIEHLGRLKHKLLTLADQREFAAVVKEASDSIEANAKKTVKQRLEHNTWTDRAKTGVAQFFAMHRKFANVMREMDGWKDNGVLWNLFVKPLNAAADRESGMREKATLKLTELFKPMLDSGKMSKKIYIPEIRASLSREGRLMVALNTGNAGNLQRLMDGDHWTEAQVQAVVDTLSKEEMDFVQSIWDFISEYRTEIGQQQKRLTGVEPEWVEPRVVQTRHGEYRGGYLPAKYDTTRSTRSLSDEAAAGIMDQWRATRGAAKTRDSFTKERAKAVVDRPLRKDFGVVFQHVTEVSHRLAMQEYLIDANRLLRASAIDNAIREHYGHEVLESLRDAIEDIAAGELPAQNAFEGAVNHLRMGATIAGLGWRVTTSLLQPLGLTQSMVRIGPKWVAMGLAEWVGDAAKMENTAKRIYEKSDMMRLRGKTMQREISEIRNKVAGKNSAIEASYFYLIQKMQMVADIPTWLGQYHKAIAAGADEKNAVAQADQAVLDAQGGGQMKDLAAIQRGGPLLKLFTNFYSFFNTTFNMTKEATGRTNFKDPIAVGRLAVDYLLLYSVPAALGTLMKAALGGEDDEEGFLRQLIADQLTYMFGTMVGLRELAGALRTASGLPGDYSGPASVRVFAELAKLGKQAGQGEVDEALLKAANNVGGILFHYPAGQVNNTIDGIVSMADGREDNPGALLVGSQKK